MTTHRYAVQLVDTDYEPGRVYGQVKTYRTRWMAERRRRLEAEADERLGQSDLGEWRVVNFDAPLGDA